METGGGVVGEGELVASLLLQEVELMETVGPDRHREEVIESLLLQEVELMETAGGRAACAGRRVLEHRFFYRKWN